MELQYLFTLRGENGQPATLLRLRRRPGGYEAVRRDFISLPREAKLWILTPEGPVPVEEETKAPVLGAVLMEGGRCLCGGTVRGAEIDLAREKVRLRILAGDQPRTECMESSEEKKAPEETVPGEEPAPFPEPEVGLEPALELQPLREPNPIREPCCVPEAAVGSPGEPKEPCPDEGKETEKAAADLTDEGKETKETDADLTSDIDPSQGIDAEEKPEEASRAWADEGVKEAISQGSVYTVPLGAPETSGREPAWPVSPEAKPVMWILPKSNIDAEKDAESNVEGEEPEDMDMGAREGERGSAALQEILARAERTFSRDVPPSPTPVLGDPAGAPNPPAAREGLAAPIPNPFPNAFPGAEFQRIHRPQGQGWYLTGEMRRGGEHWRITAIPGEYQPVPPWAVQGFHRYIKARDGGYWLRIQRH